MPSKYIIFSDTSRLIWVCLKDTKRTFGPAISLNGVVFGIQRKSILVYKYVNKTSKKLSLMDIYILKITIFEIFDTSIENKYMVVSLIAVSQPNKHCNEYNN